MIVAVSYTHLTTEILNDPYGFTYKEMSEVIREDKARALYCLLYTSGGLFRLEEQLWTKRDERAKGN